MVRCELRLDALGGQGERSGHDSGIVDQDVDLAVSVVDLLRCLSDALLCAQVDFENGGFGVGGLVGDECLGLLELGYVTAREDHQGRVFATDGAGGFGAQAAG